MKTKLLKGGKILKYTGYALLIYSFAVMIAYGARYVLGYDSLSELITGMIDGAVGAIALYQKMGFEILREPTDGYAYGQKPETCIQMVQKQRESAGSISV